MEDKNKIPERSEVQEKDKWDLKKLYKNDREWDEGLIELQDKTEKIADYKGKLGTSAEKLEEFLLFMNELGLLEERLGYYSNLKLSEDGGGREESGKIFQVCNCSNKGPGGNKFHESRTSGSP